VREQKRGREKKRESRSGLENFLMRFEKGITRTTASRTFTTHLWTILPLQITL
jgi:hypothetical protein